MPFSRLRLTERQILHLIMFACFAGFAGALLLASFRQRAARADLVKRPVVNWTPPRPNDPSRQLQYRLADLQDPSLMSLPNPHGFSEPLWQRIAATVNLPEHPAPPTAYLDTEIPREDRPLLQPPALADTARAAAVKLPVAFTETPSAAETMSALHHSILELNHGLEQLRLLTTATPPTIPGETPLRPSRARVAVAADGTVRHVMLERPSGNEIADTQALTFARSLRFAPRFTGDSPPGANLVWGTVRFVWATKLP